MWIGTTLHKNHFPLGYSILPEFSSCLSSPFSSSFLLSSPFSSFLSSSSFLLSSPFSSFLSSPLYFLLLSFFSSLISSPGEEGEERGTTIYIPSYKRRHLTITILDRHIHLETVRHQRAHGVKGWFKKVSVLKHILVEFRDELIISLSLFRRIGFSVAENRGD